MARIPLPKILFWCCIAACVAPVTTDATEIRYVEDFLTDTYKNPSYTTASWNTTAGELSLFPFELTLVGSYDTPGTGNDIEVRGNYAYMACGSAGLVIVDITAPTAPALVGSYNTIGNSTRLAVTGKRVFVADAGGGLRIIDVTNPASPAELGSYVSTNDVTAVAVDGTRAYIADAVLGLVVLDVSNPALPVVEGTAAASAGIVDLDADGNLVFAANSLSGIEIYDVSAPAAPVLLATHSSGGAWSVAVQGDVVFGSTATDFVAVGISKPSSPLLVGSVSTAPGTVTDITLDGFNAYAAGGSGGMLIVDVVDPASLNVVHQFALTEAAHGVAHAGEHAFVANDTDGLRVIDVTELAPAVPGGSTAMGTSNDMIVRGSLVYMAAGCCGHGLEIVDMSDPMAPVVVGSYPSADASIGIDVVGHIAYVADRANGLMVIDVSDPSSPVEIGYYDTPNAAFDVVVAGDYAFVADSAAVRVFDVSDPTNPLPIGVETAPTAAIGAVLHGNYLYITQGHAGYGVVDVSDPTSPALVGSWAIPGYAENLVVDGDHLFMANYHGGLQIVDISTPTAPVVAGVYTGGFLAIDIDVSGDFAVLATGATAAKIVDISDTSSPSLITDIPVGIGAQRLRMSGELLCVGGASDFALTKIFENRVVFADNIARSLTLVNTDDEIIRARLLAAQVGVIDWELYATSWVPAPADGSWQKFSNPNTSLVWRCWLYREPNATGSAPSCSQLEIDWRYEFCVVNGVRDVPGDEGGWIEVDFTRSGYDFTEEASTPVLGYNIHLRIDDPALAGRIVADGRLVTDATPRHIEPATSTVTAAPSTGAIPPPAPSMNSAGARSGASSITGSPGAARLSEGVDNQRQIERTVPFVESGPGTKTYEFNQRFFVVSDGPSAAAPPGLWEIVGSVFAQQADTYALGVPSRGDSSAVIPYSVCYVSTHTTLPGVFFNSPVDSGYSVDNLPPASPLNFTVAYNTSGGNDLAWDPSPEPDFQFYRVYRGTDPGFVPGPANLVHSTSDPYWTDSAPEGWRYHYKITSVDYSGNESAPSAPTIVTAVTGDAPAPDRFALHQNVPNPFNPSTVVVYDVPPSGGHVRLAIYDVGGRLIRVLVDEAQTPGAKRVVWNGRDAGGAQVASGVYFLKMRAPGFEQTLKMSLIQ